MTNQWTTVCKIDDLVDNSGVCALVEHNQVALFKVVDNDNIHIFAVSNWDPVGQANVLYRGLVGSSAEQTLVISPLYKQRYCMSTGRCLDDENISLQTYEVRQEGKDVQLKLVR